MTACAAGAVLTALAAGCGSHEDQSGANSNAGAGTGTTAGQGGGPGAMGGVPGGGVTSTQPPATATAPKGPGNAKNAGPGH